MSPVLQRGESLGREAADPGGHAQGKNVETCPRRDADINISVIV